MAEEANDHNYECMDVCDDCDNFAQGTMFHAKDAMGIATPVLFLCHACMKGERVVPNQ